MDLLKFLTGSNKFMSPCFLCFKNDKNNFNINAVFEIRNDFDVICISLADMLKKILPIDFLFMHACNDCSDLISELYILIHNRQSKLLLLDCIVKQLVAKTNVVCGTSLTNDELVFNVEVPSYQELNKDLLSSEDNIDQHEDKSFESIDINKDTKVVEVCQYCTETFPKTEELRLHLKVHTHKRKRRRVYHYCSDCNYKTLSKTTLQAHINKNHLNTRPHICQVCYKGFYNRSNLNEHVKTHNNQRNQVCEMCGGSFIHKKSLIEHLRLHSDTRPYKCDICYKSFVTSGRRSDHIKRSHMEKTECCLVCNKKYSLKKELTRHMNNVHLRGM